MFYERLQELCKKRKTSVSRMLNDLGLSTGNTGNWKKGQLPKGDVLVRIAEYLDASIDDIVFGETGRGLSDGEKRLLALYGQTPERARYKVLCDMERIVGDEIEKLEKEKGEP